MQLSQFLHEFGVMDNAMHKYRYCSYDTHMSISHIFYHAFSYMPFIVEYGCVSIIDNIIILQCFSKLYNAFFLAYKKIISNARRNARGIN
jgi:hypothetical protein